MAQLFMCHFTSLMTFLQVQYVKTIVGDEVLQLPKNKALPKKGFTWWAGKQTNGLSLLAHLKLHV